MRSLQSISAILTLAISASLPAQVLLDTGPNVSAGITSKNVVRNAAGDLFSVAVNHASTSNHPLLLRRSSDGGQTWAVLATINDVASGLTGPVQTLTNNCALAIDDTGVLHCLYASYIGAVTPNPANFREYYRRFDPATTTLSAVVPIVAAGATVTTRNQGTDITIDGLNNVWITAQGPTTDVERLFVSQVPYAANDFFLDLGNISVSASAQLARICVDAAGWIHCTYYRNVAPGIYEHRIYIPGTGWQAPVTIGNTTVPNDYYGGLGADVFGNVHAVFEEDTLPGTANTWKWRYRRWDVANGWTNPEIPVFDATYAQYNLMSPGQSGHYLCSMGVNEATGATFAAYRDLSTNGALRVARKQLGDPGFTIIADVTPPSTVVYDTFLPAMRGSLYPPSNNTGSTVDLTWQRRPQPSGSPFEWWFARVDTEPVSITLGAPPFLGTTCPVLLKSLPDPGRNYVCGFALGTTPGIALSDSRIIPLNWDGLLILALTPANGVFFDVFGALDGGGRATVTIAIPVIPGASGATIYGAFVIADSTNTTGIGTISPSLPITLL